MRNKNLWVILAALALVILVAVLAMVIKPAPAAPTGETLATATDITSVGEPDAYLLITVGDITYQPLPLNGEGEFSLTQGETGKVNVVHVTPDSIWMADSTCDNQDCVEQGVVSLETMNDRVLGNMIICLPHQVTLELYSAEEMNALIASLEEAP